MQPTTCPLIFISNPCFELWLVLHHRDFHRFCDTRSVESLSRSLDGRAGKSINTSRYLPHRKEAARRARLLDKRHEHDGTAFPDDNPSSGMHRFLHALEGDALWARDGHE
jgi:hypothetical protein